MNRTGIIIEEQGRFARVKLLRHTACGNCGACHLGDEQKDVFLTAKNDIGGLTGDMVEVSMQTGGVLSAAFIMYMIPLALFFVGLGLGNLTFKTMGIANHEQLAAILGIFFMGLTFWGIKLNDKKFLSNEKYTANIDSIVKRKSDDLEKVE